MKKGMKLFLGSGFSVLAKNIENKKKKEYNEFLTNKFCIDKLSGDAEKYKVLNNLNFKSIFTTNIDNLINKIYENSNNYYLNDVTIRGPKFNERMAIDYIPLHGSVLYPERGYNFNVINVGSESNNILFQRLKIEVEEIPILFWGYSLSDNNVINAIFSNPNWKKTILKNG